MNTITKVVRPGMVKIYKTRRSDVFCKIKITKEEKGLCLSITGVVGPTRYGNCAGSYGQIVMSWRGEYAHNLPVDFAPGWSQELFDKFLDVWDVWHLNDMHAKTLPQEVIDFLVALPDTDKQPAWFG